MHFALSKTHFERPSKIVDIPTATAHTELWFKCKHKVLADKKDAGYFLPYRINAEKAQAQGAKRADYIEAVSALVLDVDSFDGCPIEYITKHSLDDFNLFCYTSHSHSVEQPKFRLIIPLLYEVSQDLFFGLCKEFLTAKFTPVDPASFNRIGFYLPSCPAEKKEFASSFAWDGWSGLLDFEKHFRQEIGLEKFKRTTKEKVFRPSSMAKSDKFKQFLIDNAQSRLSGLDFSKRGGGVIHHTLLKVHADLLHNGLQEAEIFAIMADCVPLSAHKELKGLSR